MTLNGFWFCIGTGNICHVQMDQFLDMGHTHKHTPMSLMWFEEQGFLCCVILSKPFALFSKVG